MTDKGVIYAYKNCVILRYDTGVIYAYNNCVVFALW